jgi:phosphoribosyl-ATP pyrophosphohydrolase
MRSVLCALAVVWFVFAASTVPQAGEGLTIATAADATPFIVHDIAQMLFVGLALLAAAGINWTPIVDRLLGRLLEGTPPG